MIALFLSCEYFLSDYGHFSFLSVAEVFPLSMEIISLMVFSFLYEIIFFLIFYGFPSIDFSELDRCDTDLFDLFLSSNSL